MRLLIAAALVIVVTPGCTLFERKSGPDGGGGSGDGGGGSILGRRFAIKRSANRVSCTANPFAETKRDYVIEIVDPTRIRVDTAFVPATVDPRPANPSFDVPNVTVSLFETWLDPIEGRVDPSIDYQMWVNVPPVASLGVAHTSFSTPTTTCEFDYDVTVTPM